MPMGRATARGHLPMPSPGTRVSVVIPSYNYGRYLGDAIRSALSQTGVDLDVIVVDDASTDDSLTIAERFAESDSRVSIVRHARNRGHLQTYNHALSLATGDYVVKLDADDLLTPNALSRSAGLLCAHPEVAFVYGKPREFSGPVPDVDAAPTRSWTVWDGEAWIDRVLRRGHNIIMQPEVMIRRSSLCAVGGYDQRLPWAEDYNLWLRLATRGSVGRVNGPVQGLYRVHSDSLQRSSSDLLLSDLRARIDATRYFLDASPSTRSRRRTAWRSLAREARRDLAARENATETVPSVVAEYTGIIESLESEAPGRSLPDPLLLPGVLGRAARRVHGVVRWRRWQATGL